MVREVFSVVSGCNLDVLHATFGADFLFCNRPFVLIVECPANLRDVIRQHIAQSLPKHWTLEFR